MEPFLAFEALQYRFVKLPLLLCVVNHVILRENIHVVFATPVSQKRRCQPIYFIFESLSAPMNVPYTKFSGNSMENLNHNASSLRVDYYPLK